MERRKANGWPTTKVQEWRSFLYSYGPLPSLAQFYTIGFVTIPGAPKNIRIKSLISCQDNQNDADGAIVNNDLILTYLKMSATQIHDINGSMASNEIRIPLKHAEQIDIDIPIQNGQGLNAYVYNGSSVALNYTHYVLVLLEYEI